MPKIINIDIEKKDQLKSGIQKLMLFIPEDSVPSELTVFYECDFRSGRYANIHAEKIVDFYYAKEKVLPPGILKILRETYAKIFEYYEGVTKTISRDETFKLCDFFQSTIKKRFTEDKEIDNALIILMGESHSSECGQLLAQMIFAIYQGLQGKVFSIEDSRYPGNGIHGIFDSSAMHTIAAIASAYRMQVFAVDSEEESKKCSDFAKKYPYDKDLETLEEDELKKLEKDFCDSISKRDAYMGENILKTALQEKKSGNFITLVGCGFLHLAGIMKYIKEQGHADIDILAFNLNPERNYRPYCGEQKKLMGLNYFQKHFALPEEVIIPPLPKDVVIFCPYNNLKIYEQILEIIPCPIEGGLLYPEFVFAVMRAFIKDFQFIPRVKKDLLDKINYFEKVADIDPKALEEIQHIQIHYFPEAHCSNLACRIDLTPNPLFWAIEKGDRRLVRQLLSKKTQDFQVKDGKTDRTPVEVARALKFKGIAKDLEKAKVHEIKSTGGSFFKSSQAQDPKKNFPETPDKCCRIL